MKREAYSKVIEAKDLSIEEIVEVLRILRKWELNDKE